MKKSQKHETNLQKNTTLYFQVGLIVCLMATFGLLEMKFERETSIEPKYGFIDDNLNEISIDNFKIYEAPKTEVKPDVKKKVLLTDNIKKEDDDYQLKDLLKTITSEQNTSSDPPIDPSKISVDKPVDPVDVSFIAIQNAPIYPGCEKEKNNADRKKCMSDKITKLIQRKFDGSDIASDYGLTGQQKINIQFTIDKTGKVTNIKTRAPHPKLQDEAERVINLVPEMIPGKQNDKNVGVIYTLPIIFQVQ